jgi:thioredoxin-dependent peroxiredoxin
MGWLSLSAKVRICFSRSTFRIKFVYGCINLLNQYLDYICNIQKSKINLKLYNMATITLKGNSIHTIGTLPAIGTKAPDFLLTAADLSDVNLSNFAGKRVVLNIFPSVDTGVCAASVRRFNVEVEKLKNTVVLCISADLPFALSRFCGAEGLSNVVTLSELRNREFGDNYGIRIIDGPLAGLLSRCVVVLDEKGTVIYSEQVPEIAQEPEYAPVMELLK